MKRLFEVVFGVVLTIFGAAVAGVLAMVVFSLIALVVVTASGGELDSVQTNVTMIAAYVVGAGTVVVWAIAARVKRARRAARARQIQANAEAEKRRQSRDAKVAEIVSYSTSAAHEFSFMPTRLQDAAQQYARAKRTYLDGAFSPFWSTVEAAYSELAAYTASAKRIANLAERHASAVQQLVGADEEVATFSVVLNAEDVQSQHLEILSCLESIVYEAQKQPTFATIWEQRRTTAAVVQGFRNLEDAVNSMGYRVSSSLAEMESSLARSNSTIGSAVGAQAHTASVATTEQLEELRRARKAAEGIRDHLRYPELSRWLG